MLGVEISLLLQSTDMTGNESGNEENNGESDSLATNETENGKGNGESDPLATDVSENEKTSEEAANCLTNTCGGSFGDRLSSLPARKKAKDERCSKLKIYPILQKVFLERILRRPEIDAFAEELRPHQKALLLDKSTVLDWAMIEHNLLVASKLYTNIRSIFMDNFVQLQRAAGSDRS